MTSARRLLLLGGSAVDPTGAAIKTKLTAWWELVEASGQRNDSHTNALHLTDNNTVTQGAGIVSAYGNSADFERANSEYLSHAANALFQAGDQSFAFCFWMQFESFNAFHNLFLYDSGGASRDYTIDWNNGSSALDFVVWDTVGAKTVNGSIASPTVDTPYFVYAYHDADNDAIGISINDGSVSTTTGLNPLRASSAINFSLGGRTWSSGNEHDGELNGVAWFQGNLLTAAEVTWLYNGGSGRAYSDLG